MCFGTLEAHGNHDGADHGSTEDDDEWSEEGSLPEPIQQELELQGMTFPPQLAASPVEAAAMHYLSTVVQSTPVSGATEARMLLPSFYNHRVCNANSNGVCSVQHQYPWRTRWTSRIPKLSHAKHRASTVRCGLPLCQGHGTGKMAFPDTSTSVCGLIQVHRTSHGVSRIQEGVHEGGQGATVWDTFTSTPGTIVDNSSGEIADDHYHRWRDDIAFVKRELGVTACRFSTAWSRIFPIGRGPHVNREGIEFYGALIDELLANDREPWIILFHGDLPQSLQDECGGFLDRQIVDDFVEDSRAIFDAFASTVTQFITLNEPWTYAVNGLVRKACVLCCRISQRNTEDGHPCSGRETTPRYRTVYCSP